MTLDAAAAHACTRTLKPTRNSTDKPCMHRSGLGGTSAAPAAGSAPRSHPERLARYRDTLQAIVDGVLPPSLVFQPIVDLQRGQVAGYETLARFPAPPKAAPDVWLEVADELGIGTRVEAALVAAALEAVKELPDNTFLTINASPALLASADWCRLREDRRDLTRVVIELTEHAAIADYQNIRPSLESARKCGASFGVDDVGAGYASMQHVLALRPDFIKLDRQFTAGCESDSAKAAMIEAIGSLAGRLDAWIVAEGVERHEELESLVRLGVPLAQGYFLSRPAPKWATLDPAIASFLTERRRRAMDRATVARLIEAVMTVEARETGNYAGVDVQGAAEWVLAIDEHRRPVHLLRRDIWTKTQHLRPDLMRIKATSRLGEVLRRAMVRPAATRFDPLVCIEEDGSVAGLVRIEHLVTAAADQMR